MEIFASLSVQERLDMQLKGFNPFDPSDVKRYKSGGAASVRENINRRQESFKNSVSGKGGDPEIDAESLITRGVTFNGSEDDDFDIAKTFKKPTTQQDMKQALREEMNSSYGNNAGKTFTTDDFYVPKKPVAPGPIQQSQQGVDYKNEGFVAARQYLNAVMLNLQSPSTQSRLNIFKLVKICLEGEQKYKDNPQALQLYRQGVVMAEQTMYQKLSQ